MKIVRLFMLGLFVIGVILTAKSGWFYVKGVLAQHLLHNAWFKQKTTGKAQKAWDWSESTPTGKLLIPSIDLSHVILDNSKNEALAFGPGHIKGTALPGEPGNIGIAGHRDSFFKRLEDVDEGEFIGIEHDEGLQIFQVSQIEIIEPSDTHWFDATNFNCLTLVTCYPFQFDGNAPQRFIVRANSVYSQ